MLKTRRFLAKEENRRNSKNIEYFSKGKDDIIPAKVKKPNVQNEKIFN